MNEVLYNEPGSSQTLEWFEIYNDAIQNTNLGFYQLVVKSDTLIATQGDTFQLSGNAGPGMYLVVCRDTLMFKATWPETAERTNTKLFQHSFALTNNAGSVAVLLFGSVASRIVWSSPGTDGVSLERVAPASSNLLPSLDSTGATGGFINSRTALPRDLVLNSIQAIPNDGITTIRITIESRSTGTISDGTVRVFVADSNNLSTEGTLLTQENLPPIDTGFTTLVNIPMTLSGVYQFIGVAVGSDDRNRNNRKNLLVPAQKFPPFRLNECLVDPVPALFSEWVEIKNKIDQDWPITGWQIGDAVGEVLIPGNALVSTEGYLVVCQNLANFNAYYSGFSGEVVAPATWPSLNDNGDIVRLIDPFGYEADRYSYVSTFGDNISWSRGEDSARENDWGRSEATGGSPGARNVIRFSGDTTALVFDISPQIFSPDGDGVDDSLIIALDPPEAKGYVLKIYDRDGRVVQSYLDGASDFRGSYSWDGKDESGTRLPMGMYVIYFEAQGVQAIKKVVVIAR